MILSTVSLGFEVANFTLEEGLKTLFKERIEELKPKLSTISKVDYTIVPNNKENLVLIITISLTYESEVITKSVRSQELAKFRNLVLLEMVEYFKSNGILYNPISVD